MQRGPLLLIGAAIAGAAGLAAGAAQPLGMPLLPPSLRGFPSKLASAERDGSGAWTASYALRASAGDVLKAVRQQGTGGCAVYLGGVDVESARELEAEDARAGVRREWLLLQVEHPPRPWSGLESALGFPGRREGSPEAVALARGHSWRARN